MEDNEFIEAYFRNELSLTDRDSFQVRLNTDKDFASKVDQYQLITEEIRQWADETDLLEKMNQWDEEDSGLQKQSFISTSLFKIAAVLIPIIVVTVLIYNQLSQSSPSNQDLFSSYFSPYEDVISNRTVDEGSFGLAMNYYNSVEYDKAVELFDKSLRDEKDSENAMVTNFYLAMSYMALGEIKEAELLLRKVEQDGSPLFREVSQWYLLLGFIKTGETRNAEKQMTLILNDKDHLYFQQARELKEEW